MRLPIPRRLRRHVESLSFPKLFLLTGTLFLVTLVVPDPLPFVDEILLGLLTLMIGSVRRRKTSSQDSSERPENTK